MNNLQLPLSIQLAIDFEKEVWTGQLEGVSSPYLKMTWAGIFTAFEDCKRHNAQQTKPPKRIVVPAPTGTGKTQAMCYYASQLEKETGMLIVTSFIDEANIVAKTINKYAGETRTVAFHNKSQYWTKVDELKEHQVLVITHNQFVGATDRKQNEIGVGRSKIDKLYQYLNGKRQVVVIDESIETIQHTNLSRRDIQTLQQQVANYQIANTGDTETNQKLDVELEILQQLDGLFDKYQPLLEDKPNVSLDVNDIAIHLKGYNTKLTTLAELNKSGKLKDSNKAAAEDTGTIVSKIITSISNIVNAHWAYYSQDKRNGVGNVIRTARDALPEDTTTVILDATSNIDYYYEIHSDIDLNIAEQLPLKKVRRYENVKLFLSPEQNTGKSGLTKTGNTSEYIERIGKEVDKPSSDSKVVVFTFKDLEVKLHKFLDNNWRGNIFLGHFGDLNGKNNYSNCTTLYIIGTPHKPEHLAINTQALSNRGLDCFNDSEEVAAERLQLKNTQIAAELVQAINRVSCRRVIDEKGNCADTSIYLTMPDNNTLATTILDSIKKQMPGINVIEDKWDFVLVEPKKRGPKAEYIEKFIKLLPTINSEVTYASIAKILNLTRKQKETLRAKLVADELKLELDEHSLNFYKRGQYRINKK